jgi:S-adenosylmethionine:tRNA ribosyltransferase-isomerase
MEALEAKGVAIEAITLHTGVASLEQPEAPYEEWFDVGAGPAEAVNARRSRGRVIAVGTTVVRALESAITESSAIQAAQGWTDLVITPERGVSAVTGLLTGFHEPKASHFGILEAFAGRRHIEIAYETALNEGYLWHEFGDLHLIL